MVLLEVQLQLPSRSTDLTGPTAPQPHGPTSTDIATSFMGPGAGAPRRLKSSCTQGFSRSSPAGLPDLCCIWAYIASSGRPIQGSVGANRYHGVGSRRAAACKAKAPPQTP